MLAKVLGDWKLMNERVVLRMQKTCLKGRTQALGPQGDPVLDNGSDIHQGSGTRWPGATVDTRQCIPTTSYVLGSLSVVPRLSTSGLLRALLLQPR